MKKVAFIGGAEVGRRFLEILTTLPGVRIVGVMPGHLGEEQTPLIAPFARARGLPLVDQLDAVCAADAVLSVGNHRMFSPAQIAQTRIVNFHAAPLPDYAGSAAHAWATLNAAKTFGVTFHYVTRELDAGPVLLTRSFAVDPSWTAAELEAACVDAGAECLAGFGAAMLRGELPPRAGVKPAHIYKRADIERHREIDLAWPSEQIWRHIRAFDWPGILKPAFVQIDGREIYLTAKPRGTWL